MESKKPAEVQRMIEEFNMHEGKKVLASDETERKRKQKILKELEKKSWTPREMANFIISLEKFGFKVLDGAKHRSVMFEDRLIAILPYRGSGHSGLDVNAVKGITDKIREIIENAK